MSEDSVTSVPRPAKPKPNGVVVKSKVPVKVSVAGFPTVEVTPDGVDLDAKHAHALRAIPSVEVAE